MKNRTMIICALVFVAVVAGSPVVDTLSSAELGGNAMQSRFGAGKLGAFLTGVSCGLTLMASVAAAVSPEPFSKLAVAAYAGTVISCVSYFL